MEEFIANILLSSSNCYDPILAVLMSVKFVRNFRCPNLVIAFFFFLFFLFFWQHSVYNLICRYEGALDPWLMSLWKTLNHINPKLLPEMSEILHPTMRKLEHPKFKIIYHPSNRITEHDSHISGKIYCYVKLNLSSNIYQGFISLEWWYIYKLFFLIRFERCEKYDWES